MGGRVWQSPRPPRTKRSRSPSGSAIEALRLRVRADLVRSRARGSSSRSGRMLRRCGTRAIRRLGDSGLGFVVSLTAAFADGDLALLDPNPSLPFVDRGLEDTRARPRRRIQRVIVITARAALVTAGTTGRGQRALLSQARVAHLQRGLRARFVFDWDASVPGLQQQRLERLRERRSARAGDHRPGGSWAQGSGTSKGTSRQPHEVSRVNTSRSARRSESVGAGFAPLLVIATLEARCGNVARRRASPRGARELFDGRFRRLAGVKPASLPEPRAPVAAARDRATGGRPARLRAIARDPYPLRRALRRGGDALRLGQRAARRSASRSLAPREARSRARDLPPHRRQLPVARARARRQDAGAGQRVEQRQGLDRPGGGFRRGQAPSMSHGSRAPTAP